MSLRSNISKTRASCFIRGSKHRETDKSTRPQAECFYCFEVFGIPDETRSTSFWYSFLNELPTIIVCTPVIKMVSLECAIWELASLLSFKNIQFSVRDGRVKFNVSDSQNF